MRPVRSIATALLVASLALVGCGTRDGGPASPPAAPPSSVPGTVAPTTPPAPRPTVRPPSTAEAVATAVAFMRREVGMPDPVAGPFRWTGARTGQVDIRSRIAQDVNPLRGPVTTVSLQRLTKVWYVLGTRTNGIRVVSPRPQDPIRSPLDVLASVSAGAAVLPVRVTQDRYGKDIELGRAYLTRQAETTDLSGQVAFRRPSGPTGSVIFTTVSGHNGEVWSAAVIRVRLASTVQPPQILAVSSSPRLVEVEGWLQLPEVVSFQVTATRATRARLILTPTGTGTAWSASVVAEDRTAGDGLRLTWHPDHGALGHLAVEVLGPGGTTSREIGEVHRE